MESKNATSMENKMTKVFNRKAVDWTKQIGNVF